MSEDPAPYWISRAHVEYSEARGGWIVVTTWEDSISGHELRAESEATFSTEIGALRHAHCRTADTGLFERLLVEHPRDMERYWRAREPWLYPED
ncbi:MAG: hypothetical protein ACREM3_12985 [Candidatus Rokuibacteriota bacterium]